MWPRIVETMLACWLATSPFVFAEQRGELAFPFVSWAAAAIVMICSLACYWPRAYRANLVTAAIGAILVGGAWLAAGGSASPPLQNFILIGLLLAMLGIIPTATDLPPRKWDQYYAMQPRDDIESKL